MGFKIRIETDPSFDDEIIIRSKALDSRVLQLQRILAEGDIRELELYVGENIFFVPQSDILFFETSDKRLSVHTKDRIYYTDKKLYEIEETLPRSFMRISKSCIVNLNAISSIRREITGICEASFFSSPKKVFISRSYYKPFREKITEIRKV